MKYYTITPTYKKSVLEMELWKRPYYDNTNSSSNNDGADEENHHHNNDNYNSHDDKEIHTQNYIYFKIEVGWRSGEFEIQIPETQDELRDFLHTNGDYETLQDYLDDHGVTSLEEILLPNEEDEFIDITEDYNAEMISTWDGCWTTFTIEDRSLHQNIITSEEMREQYLEEAEQAYKDEYEEGLLQLGWERVDGWYEIHCKVKVERVLRPEAEQLPEVVETTELSIVAELIDNLALKDSSNAPAA